MSRRTISAATVAVAALATVMLPERWLWFVAIGVTATAIANIGFDFQPWLAMVRTGTSTDPLASASDRQPSALDPEGLRVARQRINAPCDDGALPPDVWERLVVAARLRFDDIGIDLANASSAVRSEAAVSPELWQILQHRPSAGDGVRPADTASTIIDVLTELESLTRSRSAT